MAKEKENLFGGGALFQKLRDNVFVANNMQQAQNLAEQGRNGDSMLMHMSPLEIEALNRLGQITINPVTGLPEAFKLRDILPALATVAATAGGASPLLAASISGATTAATTGNLQKGLLAGLMSYGVGRAFKGLGGDEIASAAEQVAGAEPAVSEVVTTAARPEVAQQAVQSQADINRQVLQDAFGPTTVTAPRPDVIAQQAVPTNVMGQGAIGGS